MSSKVYIKATTQISMQQPLTEEWMTDPVVSGEPYVRCIDPNFREWLNPLESRRMGKILKRALVTAGKVMRDTGITQPDAIITGTGLGCIENTQLFLDQLCREGEEMLKPTYFMQSTHNTISSLIAIHNHCHGYNTTYSHKGVSFDSALLDAFTQLRLSDIQTALVTGNDELTPSYFSILQRTGYVGQPGQVPASEASVAMMLTTDPADALCEVEDIRLSYGCFQLPDNEGIDRLMLGINGTSANDEPYDQVIARYPDILSVAYKRLFGEGYAVSGLGIYAAAHILNKGEASQLLFANHSDGRSFSIVKLRSIKN